MIHELSKLQVLECESCQFSKHVRSSFPIRIETTCNSIFSLIHFDIWDPSRVSSFGFCYLLTSIDEYSWCIGGLLN